MSRVGKNPIALPSGVEAKLDPAASSQGTVVTVKGPKGELTATVHPLVSVSLTDAEDGSKAVVVSVAQEDHPIERAHWGTARANIANMVQGVTEGFSKQLEVNGVGYRVSLSGNKLVLVVGYSHEVPFELPEGIEASVEGNVITLNGIDRQKVGQVAAEIRSVRKPEPYKGKGIKYVDEVIRRKAGKAAKAGE